MNKSHNTLYWNEYREADASAHEGGFAAYEKWIFGATAEGYLGDKAIYDDLIDAFRKELFVDFIIDGCYNLNNFDKVETYYSLPAMNRDVPGGCVLGGLLYTIEVNRADELDFHQSFYFNYLPGRLRLLVDTLQPFRIRRGSTRTEMLGKGRAVVAGMISKIEEHLQKISAANDVKPSNAEDVLKKTHIGKSSREAILKLFQKTSGTLWDLSLAAATYADQLFYEEGLKYNYVAGRILFLGQ